jgi:hypothetical protein
MKNEFTIAVFDLLVDFSVSRSTGVFIEINSSVTAIPVECGTTNQLNKIT